MHAEILGPLRLKVLHRIAAPATDQGFYLAGGTSVALQFGHRRSVDFDWFTNQSFNPSVLSASLTKEFPGFEITSSAEGTLHGIFGGVQMSFLYYNYHLLAPLVVWPSVGVQMASLDDLGAMKLAAVSQRTAKKDFVDVYALIERHQRLTGLLELYHTKYQIKDSIHVLYGLMAAEQADLQPMPKMYWNLSWKTVKTSIFQWVKEIAP